MSVKTQFLIFIFLFKYQGIFSQDELISCNYFDSNGLYSCKLSIYSENWYNNYTEIKGIHLSGKSNDLVKKIFRDQMFITSNIPSIICKQFPNLELIELTPGKIQTLDETSFTYCKKVTTITVYYNEITEVGPNTFNNCQSLTHLSINHNRINRLDEKSFVGATNLQVLIIHYNPLKEFPKNVFKPLTNLGQLAASAMNLTVIHSDSFGFLLKMTNLHLQNNPIKAFDERIIDKTKVTFLDMRNTSCSNAVITDGTLLREQMRLAVKSCIENYEKLPTETTISSTVATTSSYFESSTTSALTTLPGCTEGNLDERMCVIEDEVHRSIKETLKNLQDRIDSLESRPCACK